MHSTRGVYYDRIPIGLALSSSLPTPPNLVVLFHVLAPINSREQRGEMTMHVAEWLPLLRRWFEQPGRILPQFSAFLENLGWPTFRHIQLDMLDALENEELLSMHVDSYDLFVGDTLMKREWTNEQFALHLAVELMK